MIAQYRGICRCGVPFRVGEVVTYVRRERAVVACPACASPYRARLEAIEAESPYGAGKNPEIRAAIAMIGRDPTAARRALWKNVKGWLRPWAKVQYRAYMRANPEPFEAARQCARAALAAMLICREAEAAR